MGGRRKKGDRQVVDAIVMVLQFGINMIVPIVLCVLLGVWIGRKTGALWATVPLFFVGALAGGTNIYKMVRKMIREAEKENANDFPARIAGLKSGKPEASEDGTYVEKTE